MFAYCSGLITAPELPATTLVSGCYRNMFWNCTSLSSAPELPATTLAPRCYQQMFDNCTSLNYVNVGFTKWNPTKYSTGNWLENVSTSGTFVCPSALSIKYGIDYIPSGWTIVHPATV